MSDGTGHDGSMTGYAGSPAGPALPYEAVRDDQCHDFYRYRQHVKTCEDIEAEFLGAMEELRDDARSAYQTQLARLGRHSPADPSWAGTLVRTILLSVGDQEWRRHLAAVAALLEDLDTRQLEPSERLPVFTSEAAALYIAMRRRIRREAVRVFFNIT